MLVLGTDPVEQRIARLRGADVILEADVHDDRAGDPVGEVDPIEVGDGLLHLTAALGMEAQIVVDLFVGIGVGQLDGIHEAAEVRRPGRRRAHLWPHGGGRDGQATALTAPGHPEAGRLDLRARQQEVDPAPRVRVKPTVGVRVPIHDVVREEIGIPGVELAIAAELAPRRDGQRDVALSRPLLGNRRVHLIARQDHDGWCAFHPPGRAAIPGGDAHVLDAAVEHLEDLDLFRCPERVGDDLGLQRDR